MATEFMLPELGENIETIQVAKIMVAVGDTIAEDQPLLELETDKATIEVPSSVAGTVSAIHVSEGDETQVGALVLTLGEGAAPPAPAAAPAEAAPAPEPAAPAPPTPAVPEVAPAPPPPAPPPTAADRGKQVAASPSVRRFAREIGIDVTQVPGSGPKGRVSRDDVKTFAKKLNESRSVAAPSGAAGIVEPPLPDFGQWGEITRESMKLIRRKTAEHLSVSWNVIPHVTIFDKADITDLDALRKRYADRAAKAGGKLTMAVMVCKVVASALKSFPKFNASIDMKSREIIYKHYVNLGIAVNTPRGLMVPVIRDADQKNMIQLAVEISGIAERARSGTITVDELEGSTFTISNLGRVGGQFFTPIVNYPEVAILGMGRTFTEAGFGEDGVEPRTALPLSLSFDHRIIDGADGAAFVGWIIEAIQEPLVLSLEG